MTNYYPQPQYQPMHRMVTRQPMPIHVALFHWFMIFGTAGLWIPVYLAAKRSRKQITTWQ